MKLSKLLLLSLASSAMTLATQAATVTLPGTGAGSTPGATDPNWDVYHFSNATGAAAISSATPYATQLNTSTLPAELATAADSNPYSNQAHTNFWLTPSSGALWLSVNTSAAGTPLTDTNVASRGGNGGSYAFVLNIGSSLSAAAAALSTPETVNFAQPVTLNFSLNADNDVSAFLVSKPSASGAYSQTAQLLAPTYGNFNGAMTNTGPYNATGNIAVSGTNYVNPYTQLVILLSNSASHSTPNLGGVLLQSFTATYTAIPEPSTYAAILGAATLGLAVWIRRKRA